MTLSTLKDFGDWLSPIIVKELRQGMRTRLFTTSFIVLQGFMVLFMLTGFSDRPGDDGSAPIWVLLAIALLVVMPLRGFGALSSEIRLKTMDLIALTRLSAWRIVVGKWAAQVSQSVLLTMAVLPYVVIRYFFGGVNVVAELFYLVVILLLSCLLSAVMVGFSAVSNFLVRAILAFGIFLMVIIAIFATADSLRFSSSGTGIPFSGEPGYGWYYLGFLISAVFLIYFFLDMGATRIAPEAINYSTRRRIISLLYLAGLLGVCFIPGLSDKSTVYGFAVSLISLFAMDALTEQPSDVRSLHNTFVRRGVPGQIMQFIFAPGWLTGAVYVVILGAMLYITEESLDLIPDKSTTDSLTMHVSLTGSLLFPLMLIHLFSPKSRDLFSLYFFIQLAVGIASAFIVGLQAGFSNQGIMWAGCPIPMICYLMAAQESPTNNGALLVLAWTTLSITLGVIIWQGLPHARLMLGFRREYLERRQSTAPATGSETAQA